MTWQERARELASWPGWRRHAPAAGSAAFHFVAVALVAATLGVASSAPTSATSEDFIAIELITPPPEEIVIPEAGVSPPRVATPRPTPSDPSVPTAPDPRKRPQPGQGAPVAPGTPADSDSVYIPPSILKTPGPAGLQGLVAGNNPCADPRPERRPRECKTDLAARVGNMDTMRPRSKDDLAQHFADYMPVCPYRVGCEPGEQRTHNGSHATDNNGNAAGGPGSLGGLHDSVGRLGFNPDHMDPGFGD